MKESFPNVAKKKRDSKKKFFFFLTFLAVPKRETARALSKVGYENSDI